jgi:alpha-beta hydrolase superfamily lysophospholipase
VTEERQSHRWRWAIVAGVVAIAALTALGAVAGWHFSSAVLVPDHSDWPQSTAVKAVSRDRIVLSSNEESRRPGVYGLDWQAGHAIAGPVISSDEDSVTRQLRDVQGYLVPEMDVGIDTHVYAGNPRQALGLPYRNVDVKGELGSMPAWLIPGRSRTWAIAVHGINDDPQVGLRLAPWFHRQGFPSLLITYREDLGAPSSPDGFHHMGLTEWVDLQAAVRFALAHGAQKIVLVGYSMGGALVSQFMEKSALAPRVTALVLDAPALNWKKILSFNATEMGLPSFFALPVEWAIGTRIDADWDSLDALNHPQAFHLPILLFHGTEDDIVPIETSEDFARELPHWVTYFPVPRAGHTQSWNVDPHRYELHLGDFLEKALKKRRAQPHGLGSD